MTDANTIEVAKKETMVAANVFGELQAQWEGVAPIHTGLFPVSIGRSADALVELALGVKQTLRQCLLSLLCACSLCGQLAPQVGNLSLQSSLGALQTGLKCLDRGIILVNLLLKGVDVVIIVLTRNKLTRRSDGERSEQECC